MDFDKPKVYGDTFISDGLVENEGMNSDAAFISDLVSKLSPAAEIGDMGRLPPPQAH